MGIYSKCRSPLKMLMNNISSNNKSYKKKKSSSARRVAPEGCFTVYVGPEKQRFVLKTEYANHPLFGSLLEEAACEYGFQRDGPILLPCDVDLFYRVLAEMDDHDDEVIGGKGYLSPVRAWMWRRRRVTGNSQQDDDCGQYSRLNSPLVGSRNRSEPVYVRYS